MSTILFRIKREEAAAIAGSEKRLKERVCVARAGLKNQTPCAIGHLEASGIVLRASQREGLQQFYLHGSRIQIIRLLRRVKDGSRGLLKEEDASPAFQPRPSIKDEAHRGSRIKSSMLRAGGNRLNQGSMTTVHGYEMVPFEE